MNSESKSAKLVAEDEKAVAGWLAVEDGTTYLCLDTDRGQTLSIELDATAIHGIGDDLRHGPSEVR